MNVWMSLVWVAVGAVAVGGVAATLGRSWPRLTKMIVGCSLAMGALVLSCVWMALPVTVVSTDIDSPSRPVEVQCRSAGGALRGPTAVQTDAGLLFDPAHGACEAAAWRRVASLGTAELCLAFVVGGASALLTRRRGAASRRTDRAPVSPL